MAIRRWLKTQSKEKLIELQGSVWSMSVSEQVNNGEYKNYCYIVCNGFVVGTYSEYLRCQEILDEILVFILNKEKSIFEMPKE